MELEHAVGQAIRNTRATLKLTQEVLAERSGLQIAAISRAERAEGSPNLRTLSRIAAALGVPVSELILQAEALLPGMQRTLSRAASQGSMKKPPRKVAAKAAKQPD